MFFMRTGRSTLAASVSRYSNNIGKIASAAALPALCRPPQLLPTRTFLPQKFSSSSSFPSKLFFPQQQVRRFVSSTSSVSSFKARPLSVCPTCTSKIMFINIFKKREDIFDWSASGLLVPALGTGAIILTTACSEIAALETLILPALLSVALSNILIAKLKNQEFNTAVGLDIEGKYEEAFKMYHKMEAAGDMDAANNLGVFYFLGRGVKVQKQGMNLRQKQGMHDRVKENSERALSYFTKSAEAGNATAMFNLGSLFELRKDNKESEEWMSKAVDADFHCNTLYQGYTEVFPTAAGDARRQKESEVQKKKRERRERRRKRNEGKTEL